MVLMACLIFGPNANNVKASNFVGLLSRGVLMPKLVVAMGGKRRDAGLLGNGIYFGDSVDTSAQYCRASKHILFTPSH